ncbi:MAG: pyrophosphohydrolase [Parcubacteria group bacterium]|nr:pyrophosphohydrolase [Parcubacteria group bacterium]
MSTEPKVGRDYTGVSVIFLCHDGQGNFLFQKRTDRCRDEHFTWDTGGGGLDYGDTVEGTLAKEIKEEYGVDIVSFDFLGFRDVHREKEGVKTHWIALDFKVLVNRDDVINGEPRKFSEIGWYTLDNPPQPLHSQLQGTINKYRDKLDEMPASA